MPTTHRIASARRTRTLPQASHWLRPAALVALLALPTFTACATRAAVPPAPTASTQRTAALMQVVVVRHGEKAPAPANDPVLSEAGTARAAALDSVLRAMNITDVVVSHLQRTQLTAAAVVARTHATMHVIAIGAAGVDAHVKAVADTVRALSHTTGRGSILVVGHSNTVTLIVAALGGGASPALCDSQYSQLFRVTENAAGAITMSRETYGAPDRPDPACASMK
jgi:phosphohistidine phosphatase SixA